MALILLNMFIAILEGYFRQIAPKGNEEKVGFLDLLKFLVISEFKNIEKKQQRKAALEKRRKKRKQNANKKPENNEQDKDKGNIKLGSEGKIEIENQIGEKESLKEQPLKDDVIGNTSAEKAADENALNKGVVSENEGNEIQTEAALLKEKEDIENPQIVDMNYDEEDDAEMDSLSEEESYEALGKCGRFRKKIQSLVEDIWIWIIVFIYQKIISKFLFTDQVAEGKEQGEVPQITAKVEFKEKKDVDEEALAMKDIEFYLGGKKFDTESAEGAGPGGLKCFHET